MAEGTQVGSIYYDLNLDDAQFKAGLAGAKAEAQGFGDSLQSVGKSMSSLGSTIMPFSIAAGAALGASAKMAMDFNQKMELLTTQAGASQKEVDTLKQKVLDLAPAVGQGPDKLADALYHIESVGYRGAEAMDVLKIAAEGASVGQASLDDTAYALTSTLSTQIKGAQSAAEAMGYLNAIVGAGDMRFQDLNGAISTGILSSAKVFGLSLASVGSALATLTDNGEHADEAATRLRMTMALMGAPSDKAASMLGAIGLSSNEASSRIKSMDDTLKAAGLTQLKLSQDMRQPNGMMVALQDLKTHLENAGMTADGSAALMAKAFGGGRSDAAIMTMFTNLDRMDNKFKAINANAGGFSDSWAKQQDQAAQKMKDFQAQLQVTGVELGNAFLPTLLAVAKQVGEIAKAFGNLSPKVQKAIVDFLLVVAVAGPLLKILSPIFELAGKLFNLLKWAVTDVIPFLIDGFVALAAAIGISVGWLIVIIAAVIAVGVGIYELVTHWGAVSKFVEKLWHDVAKFFENMWHDITKFVGNIFNDVVKFFKAIPGAVGSAIAALPGIALKILDALAFAVGFELRIIWLLFTKWIPDAVNATINEMLRLPGQIGNILSNAWGVVSHWVVEMYRAAVNWTINMVNGVISWIAQLPGRIGAWFGSVANSAHNVGSGLYHGFVDVITGLPGLVTQVFQNVLHAITGMAGSIANGAKNVASSMWNSFKSGLGIHSPSYIENAFTNIADAGKKTVDNLHGHVKSLADLAGQAQKVGNIGNTPIGSIANQPMKFANLTLNGDINFANKSDIDYWFSKLGRNTQLASQGLTGNR